MTWMMRRDIAETQAPPPAGMIETFLAAEILSRLPLRSAARYA
jgi:hypothetical protein